MKENEVKTKSKKMKIKNKKKFIIAIAVIAVVLIVVFSTRGNGKDIVIDNNTNVLELNASKHAEQIKGYYENADMKNQFVNEYNTLQNQIWLYIYNNINDTNTMEKLVAEVNKVLESEDWSLLKVDRYTKWNGSFYMNKDNNTLIFKFANKDIEPTWINDTDTSYMFEKN